MIHPRRSAERAETNAQQEPFEVTASSRLIPTIPSTTTSLVNLVTGSPSSIELLFAYSKVITRDNIAAAPVPSALLSVSGSCQRRRELAEICRSELWPTGEKL